MSHRILIGLVAVASTALPATAQENKPDVVFENHAAEVTTVTFSPDGKRIVSTSYVDDHIWDAATGMRTGNLTGVRGHAVAFRPDGKRIAWTGFKRMAVFNTADHSEVWDYDVPPRAYSPPFIAALAWSPDGRQIATAAASSKVGGRHGSKGGIVQVFDAESGKGLHNIDDLSHKAETIDYSPDGRYLAFGTDGAGGELPSPGEIHILDTRTWKRVHLLRTKEKIIPGENRCSATGIAWSPNSRLIASASSDWTVRVWNAGTGKLQATFEGHSLRVRRVAWSSDGKRIASAGEDRTVRLWDAATGKHLKVLPFDVRRINALVFSPDGKRLAAGGGYLLNVGEVRIWDFSHDPAE